ncbi:MAG: TIGR03619 family F420-dependent LLM class oxidoreductase [Acidimicrobiales bacterium]
MSDKIEFGISMGLLSGAKEEARRAEALGYDYLLTGEHLMFYTPVANNLVSLAAAAGATETIKLMSGIVLVPLYPAALLAKQVAMLDVVSGGRFSLGVGVGGEFPKEFEAVGVPVSERGARTDEALQVIDKLLTEKDVHFDGRFTKLNGVSIAPRGIQKPRLPFWVAGRKDVAMRRAARYAEGWLPYMYTPEMLAESMTKIEAFTGGVPADRPVRCRAGCSSSPACTRTATRRWGWPTSSCRGSTTRISPSWWRSTRSPARPTTASPGCASTSTPAPARSCSPRLPAALRRGEHPAHRRGDPARLPVILGPPSRPSHPSGPGPARWRRFRAAPPRGAKPCPQAAWCPVLRAGSQPADNPPGPSFGGDSRSIRPHRPAGFGRPPLVASTSGQAGTATPMVAGFRVSRPIPNQHRIERRRKFAQTLRQAAKHQPPTAAPADRAQRVAQAGPDLRHPPAPAQAPGGTQLNWRAIRRPSRPRSDPRSSGSSKMPVAAENGPMAKFRSPSPSAMPAKSHSVPSRKMTSPRTVPPALSMAARIWAIRLA